MAEVYRRHGGAGTASPGACVGSDNLAEEVTQDVFVDLWKRPERFDPERGALRTFLLTRAHGKAVDIDPFGGGPQRSRGEERTRDRRVGLRPRPVCLGSRGRRQGEDRSRSRCPGESAARSRWPTSTAGRTGKSQHMLGEPEGTIKSRIRSGLRRLREALVPREWRRHERGT